MAKKKPKKEPKQNAPSQDNNQQAQGQPPETKVAESELKEEKFQADIPEGIIEKPIIELTTTSSVEKSVESNKEKSEDKVVVNQPAVPSPPAQEAQPAVPSPPAQEAQPAVPSPLAQEAQPAVPSPLAQEAQPAVPSPPAQEAQPAVPSPPVQEAQPAVPSPLAQEAQPAVPSPPAQEAQPAVPSPPVQEAQLAVPSPPSQESTIEEKLEAEKEQTSEKELQERQVRDFHRNQIEASLYAAGKPLTIEELSTKLEIPKKEINELIKELALDYLDRSTSLIIVQFGDRYQMQIKPEYTEKVSKFAQGGAIAEKYLRTLTLIALKQPILKSTIIKLRGSGAYEHIKYLMDNDLTTAVKKGRSEELTTTDKYSEMFGLPKDKEEMKRVMITQLGLDEQDTKEEPPKEARQNPQP